MGLVAMSTVKRLADESTRKTPPEHSSATGLACLAGDFEAAALILDIVAHNDDIWRICDETKKEDLINAVQVKFEGLLLSRPLPLYPDYDVWRKQQMIVLNRLKTLNEQVDRALATGTESKSVL